MSAPRMLRRAHAPWPAGAHALGTTSTCCVSLPGCVQDATQRAAEYRRLLQSLGVELEAEADSRSEALETQLAAEREHLVASSPTVSGRAWRRSVVVPCERGWVGVSAGKPSVR
jgi:hypothetical protein